MSRRISFTTLTLLAVTAVTLSGCSLGPAVDTSAPTINIVSQPPASPTPVAATLSASPLVDYTAKIGTLSATPAPTGPPTGGPTATLSVAPTVTPTPTPVDNNVKGGTLAITSSNIRGSSDGRKLIIDGELLNQGSEKANLTGFKIIAMIYDKKSKLLASGSSETVLKSLEPGGTTPFQVTVDRVTGADTYRLQGGY